MSLLTAIEGTDRHEIQPHVPHPRCHPDERHEITIRIKPSVGEWSLVLDLVREYCKFHWMTVVATSEAKRTVTVSALTTSLDEAFGVELHQRHDLSGTYCSHYGPVYLPPALVPVVEGVFGLDNRPVANPHFRVSDHRHAIHAATRAHNAVIQRHNPAIDTESPPAVLKEANDAYHATLKKPPGTFTAVEVANLYGFPAGNGAGQCIKLIELGGGFRENDLHTYFGEIGIPTPNVIAVSVDHAKNQPGSDADGEVMLDIEVAGSVAPKATIVVYFCPNTDRGFQDCISAAIHDRVRVGGVISISWGSAEQNYTAAAIKTFETIFSQAKTAGIPVLVAAGDNGSSDGVNDGKPHADYPASSPNVVGCGGTKLVVTNGVITETVWNEGENGGAGGGAYSDVFPVPNFQVGHIGPGATGRAVPDVSGCADPTTGYNVRVDGGDAVYGGTSAVAPLYAGLVARLKQHHAGLIDLTSALYQHNVCRDITVGSNGAFSAGPGYDVASGLGVIVGTELASALG